MAPAGTLWTVPYQTSGKIIRSAAALGGVEITIPTDYEHRVDNLKPEFKAKFPHGKIPAWEGSNGFKLFEGFAIARYISSLAPNSGLLGATAEDAALIHQWIHLADFEVDNSVTSIRGICLGMVPYSKAMHTTLNERLARTLETLEKHLSKCTFLVGERITLADIYVAVIVHKGLGEVIDPALRPKLTNLIRHTETIANQPKLKEIFGELTFAQKAIQFTPPAKEKK
ncbi:glutathione S-transferase C-terminal-like protein [Crepidotus variabilis]|uniref:Glutathione S-transferase C-terminal-like protein n=1 Tax=Crepidotus variabilis TaxID=179855 RepID=A0A9P6JRU0_9AGAR|nr:glutathione S-transferase C-terminal-like protein [Crepidotus variabilis]